MLDFTSNFEDIEIKVEKIIATIKENKEIMLISMCTITIHLRNLESF